MSQNTEVIQYFAEGVRAWQSGDVASARKSFNWCTHLDEEATDAWRALAETEAGDGTSNPASLEQIEKMWWCRFNFGKLLTTIGHLPTDIGGSFRTGLWDVAWKLCTRSDVALAYAFVMMDRGEWDAAVKTLGEANQNVPFTNIAYAAVHYHTQRWTDVLRYCELTSNATQHDVGDVPKATHAPDLLVQALSSLMAGEALCHLERYEAAINRLQSAAELDHAYISGYAFYLIAMAYRALENTKAAKEMFAAAQSRVVNEDIVRAANDESILLDTTSEDMIEQRTSKWDKSTEPSLKESRTEEAESQRDRWLTESEAELNSFIGMDAVKRQIVKLKARTKAAQARAEMGLNVESTSQHILFTGPPGCIQGDAVIAVNRAGKGFQMALKDVVRKFNGQETRKDWSWDLNIPTYVQREVDGVVRLGELVGAWYSGVKTTYTVTTDSGREIRATDEHPFLTERGWLRLDKLVVGDAVHVRGERSSRGRQSKPRYRTTCVANHPYAGSRNRVAYHRLVAEADLNGMKTEDYLNQVRSGNLAGLTFLDPDVWAVHHLDRDSSNYRSDNLKVLTHEDHWRLHAEEGTASNVQILVSTETVVSIARYGEEDTYDLAVTDDPHNFLANGFVVHNTGKTTIARVVGKLYAGLGIINSPEVVETGRPDFIGNVVGDTGLKTRAVLKRAKGKVLFLDEAYALVQDTGNGQQKDSFGKEALDVIVAEMENHRDDFVLIMAGYDQDIERLLEVNEGLKSRFPRKIEFESYTPSEIWMIAEQMASKRGAYFGEGVKELLTEQVREVLMTRDGKGDYLIDVAGNGRFVRNFIEGCEEERDLRVVDLAESRGVRVAELGETVVMTITLDDAETTLSTLLAKYL